MLRCIESNRKIYQLIESIKFHINDIPNNNNNDNNDNNYSNNSNINDNDTTANLFNSYLQILIFLSLLQIV